MVCGGRGERGGSRRNKKCTLSAILFYFSAWPSIEIKYLLLRKGKRVWIMKQTRGYQSKKLRIKELPNSRQIPLRSRITTEFSFYYLWVQKAVVLLGKRYFTNSYFSEKVEIGFNFMLITISIDVKRIKLTGIFGLLKVFEQVNPYMISWIYIIEKILKWTVSQINNLLLKCSTCRHPFLKMKQICYVLINDPELKLTHPQVTFTLLHRNTFFKCYGVVLVSDFFYCWWVFWQ